MSWYHRPLLGALCAASLAAAPAAVAQQLYKYTTPDGRVVYTDRPPADAQNAEKITRSRMSNVQSGTPSAAAGNKETATSTGPKSAAEQEQAFRQRRMEADEKARKDEKLADQKRQRDEACASQRRQLAGMQSNTRVARISESGERVFLEDNELQQELNQLQQSINKNCN
jgi:hypothetical protein